MLLKLFLCVVLLQIAYGQNTIENFILFDASNGDATMPRPLDSVTGPISINVRFPFFGKWYNVIRVYSHGLILFGNVTYTLPHNPPGPFPLKDFVCAAPYWADTDLTKDSFSNIFYREILDESTLSQISAMIKNGYPLLSASRMLWAFVVTWYRVPGHTGDPGRNTFQVCSWNSYSLFLLSSSSESIGNHRNQRNLFIHYFYVQSNSMGRWSVGRLSSSGFQCR